MGSDKFIPVVDALNGIALDKYEPLYSLGGKNFVSNRGSLELQELQSRMAELESELQELEKKSECVNSFSSLSPPLATSSPCHCPNESKSSRSSSVIEETLKSPTIGPTLWSWMVCWPSTTRLWPVYWATAFYMAVTRTKAMSLKPFQKLSTWSWMQRDQKKDWKSS